MLEFKGVTEIGKGIALIQTSRLRSSPVWSELTTILFVDTTSFVKDLGLLSTFHFVDSSFRVQFIWVLKTS